MSEQTTPQTPQPVAASGRDWRERRAAGGTLVELPFARKWVELRHVQLDRLITGGNVPDFLSPLVADLVWTDIGQGQRSIDDIQADKNFFALVDLLVTAALVNPRIAKQPTQDDEIALDDLEMGDKMFIYTITRQPLEVLHLFRQQQEADVEPVPQGENVQPVTEPVAAHPE